MATLPIPASIFFSDFSSDLLSYSIYHNSEYIGSYKGLLNTDELGDYIGFLVSDNPKICIHDVLKTPDELETFIAKQITYDHYNGKAELMKIYF